MKKFNLFAATAIAALCMFSACNKEEEFQEPSQSAVSFTAIIDSDTKTTLDGVKVCWVDGDEVSVNGSIFTATVDASDARIATFTLKAGQTIPTGFNYRIFYPASSYNSKAGAFNLPLVQTYKGEDLSAVSPMYAETDNIIGTSLVFKNVCALLAIDVIGEDQSVSSISVTADTPIGGSLQAVQIVDGNLSYSDELATAGASNTVTLNCTTPVALDAVTPVRFYVAIPEVDLSSLAVVVNSAGGFKKTLTSTKTVSVTRNTVYTLPQVNLAPVPLPDFDCAIEMEENSTQSLIESTVKVKFTPVDKQAVYFGFVEEKSAIDEAPSGYIYANDVLNSLIATLEENQKEVTLDNILNNFKYVYKGDMSMDFSDLVSPGTSYYAYAFQIDEELNVSSLTKVAFDTPEYELPVCDASYEDYLGEWVFGDITLTLTEKIANSSYAVTGFVNQSNPAFSAPAEFEMEFVDGHIILKEQDSASTIDHSTYGKCNVILSGFFTYGKQYIAYPINVKEVGSTMFVGSLNSDGDVDLETLMAGSFAPYDAVAVAFTNGTNTSYYTKTAIPAKMSRPFISTASYEDYLGEWDMSGQKITIAAKDNGSTYLLSGFKNQVYTPFAIDVDDLVAMYVDGRLVVMEQKSSATTTSIGTYGLVYLYVSGQFTIGDNTYTGYPVNSDDPNILFTGDLDGDSIIVTPGSCQYGTYHTLAISWKIATGANAGKGNTLSGTPLADMTRFSYGSEAYQAWLGQWSVQRPDFDATTGNLTGETVNDTWTISRREADKSYTIIGLEADEDDNEIIAEFQADGTFIVKSQMTNVTFTSGTSTYTHGLFACVDNNGRLARLTSMGLSLFGASLTAEGASLTPFTVNVSGLGTVPVASAKLYQIEDGTTYYYFSPTGTQLPNTLVRNTTKSLSMTRISHAPEHIVRKWNVELYSRGNLIANPIVQSSTCNEICVPLTNRVAEMKLQ